MAKIKKTNEDVSDDIAKVKELKRKTRKVLKDPAKAGETADELSDKKDTGKVEKTDNSDDVVDTGDTTDDVASTNDMGSSDASKADGVADDNSGDVAPEDIENPDGLDAEGDEKPDLGTFLRRAIQNSKDAVGKYTEVLDGLKEKVKDMGIEIPGLMDADDFQDEETPEEFPSRHEDDLEGGDDGADAGDDTDAGTDGDAGAEDGGTDDVNADGADAGETSDGSASDDAQPEKTSEGEIAKPAKTEGTKLVK